MTKDQFLAMLRQILQIVAGALVGLGYLTSGVAEMIIGAVIGVASFVWMMISMRKREAEKKAEIEKALYTPVPPK